MILLLFYVIDLVLKINKFERRLYINYEYCVFLYGLVYIVIDFDLKFL